MHTKPSIVFDQLQIGIKTSLNMPFSWSTYKQQGLYVIEGPNGSGKTTLLKTLLGIVPSISGIAYIYKPSGYRVSWVPQFQSINPYVPLATKDVVFMTRHNIKKSVLDNWVEQFGIQEYWDTSFHALSGGQKTKTLLVRALCQEPTVLGLDEPLASLDIASQKLLCEIMIAYKQKAHIFLIDHHLPQFLKEQCDTYFLFTRPQDTLTITPYDGIPPC
jgi:manganese/zinc/iron transport system ATP- binding protein